MTKQKLNRLVFVLPLAALLFVAGACAEVKATATEGKFHLVFLVSATKVEVGAPAYVEPLFFTNGKTVIGAWSYCASHFRETYCEAHSDDRFCKGASQSTKSILQASQIADDVGAVHSYCSNQPTLLSGKNFHLLSNDGAVVKVENVTFEVTPETEVLVNDRFIIPPSLALVGKTKIVGVTTEPAVKSPSLAADDPLPHFFFMASDEAFLKRIVPVARYDQAHVQTLLERSRAYAEKVKGEIRAKDRRSSDKGGKFSKLRPELVAPLFADLDRDGTTDMVVGMRAGPAQSMNNPSMPMHWYWAGTAVFLGNIEPLLFANLYQSGSFRGLVANGYSMNAPWGLVQLNSCTYLTTSLQEGAHVPMTFDFLAMPQESPSCKNFVVFRQLEDAENEYPPR